MIALYAMPVKAMRYKNAEMNGGEGGIRTPGQAMPNTGFRNRPIQPLWHLSAYLYLWVYQSLIGADMSLRAEIIHSGHAAIQSLSGRKCIMAG
jgi:hypothetical protein